MVSTDAVFWRESGGLLVQSLNVVRWMQEHWSVLPCIQMLNHKRSSPEHAQVLVFLRC